MGRRAIVLLVALVLAGLAAWAVWNFMQNVRGEAEAGQEQVTVFRAGTAGIAEGTEGNILISDFNSGGELIEEGIDEVEDTPADAIQSEEELREILNNKVAAGPISSRGILTRSQWAEIDVDIRPLSESIGSGNQAITISTSDIQGINGFVNAGDRVNMILTLDIEFDLIPVDGPTLPPDDGTEGAPGEETESEVVTYTRYVLQGLNVLAVGRDIRPEEEGDLTGQVEADDTTTGTTPEGVPAEGETEEEQGNATVFTLEVTPDQAQRIVYAFENGSVWLTLVPEDFVEVESNGVTINNLFGGDLEDAIFGN